MNPDGLLKHFDEISEAPDAVPRLRRFILDLAVRGKLVPQDQNDEPASALLKRIELEKARLVKIGQTTMEKRLAPIEKEEFLFDIPDDWSWTRMGNVTTYIQRGKSPKYSSGDGLPVISQKCVQWDGLHLQCAKKITPESLGSYDDSRFLREGDLLWNSTGTGTIGRVVRVDHPGKHLVCDSHVTVVRCLLVDEYFVCIWLRSDYVYGRIEERATGATNQVELTASLAKNQITPLPPLPEQYRIVAKVDELMALCDELEAAQAKRERRRDRLVAASLNDLNNGASGDELRQNGSFYINHLPRLSTRPEHIQQLRQAILNLAVRGRLIPQDPNDEPTSELINRIRKEKHQRLLRNSIQAPKPTSPVDPTEQHFDVPSKWLWVWVLDICHVITDGEHLTPEYSDSAVPMLSAKHVGKDSLIFDEFKFVSRETAEKCWLRCYPEERDILVVSRGGGVGRTIISGYRDYCLMGSVLLFKPVSQINERFLCCFLNSPVGNEALRRTSGASAQQAIYIAHLKRNYVVPLPPLAEQHRIVEKVKELMKLCDELDVRINNTTAFRHQLLEATLCEALFGQRGL